MRLQIFIQKLLQSKNGGNKRGADSLNSWKVSHAPTYLLLSFNINATQVADFLQYQ